jgi:UPF0755 protein
MLDEFGKQILPYEDKISSSPYTLHQLLTLASIVELEGVNTVNNELDGDIRAQVASVFYNRLNAGWSLGSDVTTYYAVKVSMSERELYTAEFNACNSYNTRATCMAGKLPVSPICNPGLESLVATFNPSTTDYFYFVADKNKKTYFTKTNSEHLALVSSLKNSGLWYEY